MIDSDLPEPQSASGLRAQPTFGELEASQQKYFISQSTKNVARSSLAALHTFMKVFGKTAADACLPLMGVEDEKFAEVLVDFEVRTTVSADTIAGYRSRLRKWNAICRSIDVFLEAGGEDIGITLKKAFDAHRLKNSGRSVAALVKASGLSASAVANWLSGNSRATLIPNNIKGLAILEQQLELTPGTLSTKLVLTRLGGKQRKDLVAERKVRLNKISLTHIKYRPNTYPPALAEFFNRYLIFKTTAIPLYNVIGEPLRRPRGTWRTTTGGDGSRHVATSKVFMSHIHSMIGWLTLPVTLEEARHFVMENGHARPQKMTSFDVAVIARQFMGKGLALEDVTPAHLVDPDLLGEFIEWRKMRVGAAQEKYVLIAMGFLALESGFLSQQVECVWNYPKLGIVPVDLTKPAAASDYAVCRALWEAKRSVWREQLEGLLPHVGRGGARKPAREALKSLLMHPDPMSFVAQIIGGHAAQRPVGRLEQGSLGASRLAIWYRDQLLLRMMASNPLRNRNYREMAIQRNLYQVRDKSWRLRFEPSDFKNERGSAKEPYDVEVPSDLWPLVEIYLREARPILMNGNETETTVFVTRNAKAFSMVTLSELLWGLTGRFMKEAEDVYGFRSHAFRHLVATAWLKANPEDYLTVAHILHDTLETVLANYAHDTPSDGLRRYNKWLSTRIQPLPINHRQSVVRPSQQARQGAPTAPVSNRAKRMIKPSSSVRVGSNTSRTLSRAKTSRRKKT